MKVWTWVATAVAVVTVGGVAGFGVAAHEQLSSLTHAPAFALPTPSPVLEPASPEPIDRMQLYDALFTAAQNPALADFHARVTDAASGEVVFEQRAGEALRPASTTKILTAAAALLELGPADRIATRVYRDGDGVVIKAAGDVWLDAEALDSLAADVAAHGPFSAVTIDVSDWDGMPELLPGWDPVDIDGGYVAPLQPAMLNGGRGLIDATGDIPRSHTPALDVAQALAERVGSAVGGAGGAGGAGAAVEVGFGAVPEGAEQIAMVESPDLTTRLAMMMKESDNVYAEAIGREVALHRGQTDAPAATMAVLAEHHFDTTNTAIHDNSGLSTLNLITPALLDSVLARAAGAPDGGGASAALHPLLAALPIASGDGTLRERYANLPGRGWVRAKTGTLDGTSGLAGTVTSEVGNVYTFAFISNGSEVLEARRAMDELASILRAY